VLFGAIEASVPFQHLETIAKLFDAAWWLLPAIYLVLFLNRFGWPYLEARSGRAVPRMIKLLCAGVILLLAMFAVIAFVYHQPITSLLATSGLVGLIVGLAVQANIANVFAGIVLSAERPFAIGDVIETEGHGVARVTDMTWRTTRMVTPTNLEISVPNSAIAEGFISNHSKAPVKTVVDVWLPPSLPIDWATDKIMEGIGRSERILREPAFGVEYGGVQIQRNQWAMNYQAYFFVDNGIESGAICSDVSHHVWQVLAEAGVTANLGGSRPAPFHQGQVEAASAKPVLVHKRPDEARPSPAEPEEGHP
jgi:potassium efflux system protein